MNMQNFVKERDEALLSLDIGKIFAYCEKYGIHVPENETVFWAAIHKSIIGITSATEEQKKRSREWLAENGLKPYIS